MVSNELCSTKFLENGLTLKNINALHLKNCKLKSVLCDWGPCSNIDLAKNVFSEKDSLLRYILISANLIFSENFGIQTHNPSVTANSL